MSSQPTQMGVTVYVTNLPVGRVYSLGSYSALGRAGWCPAAPVPLWGRRGNALVMA